jgi:hypothetical protein
MGSLDPRLGRRFPLGCPNPRLDVKHRAPQRSMNCQDRQFFASHIETTFSLRDPVREPFNANKENELNAQRKAIRS